MRAIASLRVSSAEQVDGFGLDVQEEAIRSFVEREGHELVQVFRDEGVSGTKEWHERPGLCGALAMLDAGEADLLLVYRMDRIARGLLIQELIIEQVAKSGGAVVSVTEPMVSGDDDPSRTLVRQVLGAVAQYERTMIQMRLTAGKAMKRTRGGYVGGQVPFGYTLVGDMLVPNHKEQQIVEHARRLREEGLALRTIAEQIGENPRTGKPFHHHAVNRICQVAA